MQRRKEIVPLTGLRGIAALLVVLSHYIVWYAPFRAGSEPEWLRAFFDTDQLGMTLFFTLSGFVIAYNYLALDWGGAPLRSLGRFLILRATRLYPVLLVFLLLVVLWRFPAERDRAQALWWLALHVLNVETWLPFKAAGVLPRNGTYFVSWSISTEFGMYLMFAAALIAWKAWPRLRPYLVGCAALYVLGIVALALSDPLFNYATARMPAPMEPLDATNWRIWLFSLSPYVRILNFACGAAAAVAIDRGLASRWTPRLPAIAAAAVLALLAFYLLRILGWRVNAHGVYSLILGVLFALVMLGGDLDTRLNRGLSAPALVHIGEISYSLYLFHFIKAPRLDLGMPFVWSALPLLAVNLLVGFGFAIVVAYGSYHLIERPAQNRLRTALLGPRGRDAAAGAAVPRPIEHA